MLDDAVTFGRIWRSEQWWLLELEPHVALRLKRVFRRIVSAKSFGVIQLRDTLETCRELEWFMGRFALKIALKDKRYLRRRARAHRDDERCVQQILDQTLPPRPFELALPPRRYQREAAELALVMRGLLVADDLGLGKTVTALCMISRTEARPALVVTMTHLAEQWRREVQRFLPTARVHTIRKRDPYPLLDDEPDAGLDAKALPDVLLVTYSKLAGWAETLGPLLRSVVFDEAQELRRGAGSQKGAAAYYLAREATYRMGLTGTPVYNYGGEIHAVLGACRPDALGTWSEFATEWCSAARDPRKAAVKQPEVLGRYLRKSGLMVRRTRAEVGRELPPVTRVPHHVETDVSELDAIEDRAAELARLVLSDDRAKAWHAGGQLDGLVRQATGIAKAPFVARFVELLLSQEQKVILFGWHRAVYDLWRAELAAYNPLMYTGSESPKHKMRAQHDFVEGSARLLIMSLRAGAGIDGLQKVCRTVVFGELDWSPQVHEQNTGRVYRDGQTDPVVAYYLLAQEGSDPIVADVLGVKRAQHHGIRDPGAEWHEALDRTGAHIREVAQRYLDAHNAAPRGRP